LKNMCNQTVDGHHTIEVNGVHQLFGYWHSSKYFLSKENDGS